MLTMFIRSQSMFRYIDWDCLILDWSVSRGSICDMYERNKFIKYHYVQYYGLISKILLFSEFVNIFASLFLAYH